MSPSLEPARARRYLLGEVTAEERSAIEQEYFRSDEVIDAVAAAEDELIEDYLSDQLTAAERQIFERDYLAVPHHQRRVDTIRQLVGAALRAGPGRAPEDSSRASAPTKTWTLEPRWLALAAALVIVVTGSMWLAGVRRDARPTVAENRPAAASSAPSSQTPAGPVQSPSPPAEARIFAVSLSPVSVRSAAAAPSVIVPDGTEVLVVQLEGDGTRLASGRGSIRTVTGDAIWEGPITPIPHVSSGIIARLDVPAARLPADDYVVTLFGTDGKVAEREHARYFLRVRMR